MLLFLQSLSARLLRSRTVVSAVTSVEAPCRTASDRRKFRLVRWYQDSCSSMSTQHVVLPRPTEPGLLFDEDLTSHRRDETSSPGHQLWDKYFNEMDKYLKTHGHVSVSKRDTKNHSLYAWMRSQRMQWKRGTLPWHYYRRLSAVPEFAWDKQEDRWRQNFYSLVSFCEQQGHCSVPLRASGPEHSSRLARWVVKQRHLFKQNMLPDHRRRRLEGIGFQFSPDEDRFQARLQQLVAFTARHGHPNVPRSWPEDVPLATWVNSVRLRWRRGKLPVRHYRLLSNIGFSFTPQDQSWEDNYVTLKRFTAVHGHCYPSFLENRHLNAWLSVQKRGYRMGTLMPERELKLYQLGIDWRPKREVFNERYENIKAFCERHGHFDVPQQSCLKTWIKQFQALGRKRLSKSSQKQLDSINFPWKI